ncbi:uncharacterized protein LOC112466876 [Temnothorax curvispinosus]|uniref:Uncharacterized protein LOC112466876 n=1 Tax=Temnothorax curvispinosus TaxID=300111 RepID=A0A6J1RDW8_9HYME|nr:uncharacterized protein LOC112466876 [Temnothorax curvispinosus]
MWEDENIFGKKQKLRPNAVPIKELHVEMLQGGTIQMPKMHFVSILKRKQNIVNSEKPAEDDVEITDIIPPKRTKKNNDLVPDSPDCENLSLSPSLSLSLNPDI